jgi:hypothetical protein
MMKIFAYSLSIVVLAGFFIFLYMNQQHKLTDEQFLINIKKCIKDDIELKDVGIKNSQVILNGIYRSHGFMMIGNRKYIFRDDSITEENDSTILYKVTYPSKHAVNFGFRYRASISEYLFEYQNGGWELLGRSGGIEDRWAN